MARKWRLFIAGKISFGRFMFPIYTNMKKISLLLAALVTTATVLMAQNTTAMSDPTAKILEFKNADYKMGKIPYGKPVEFVVEMKNISHDTITLANVQPACGCTTPSFVPNEKIAPGQTSKITIHYSSNTMGPFTKPSTIYFAGGLTKQVSFTGEGVQESPVSNQGQAHTEKGKVEKN